MRKSLELLGHMIDTSKSYPNLPENLKPYYVYLIDNGHSVMSIAKSLLDNTQFGDVELWELEAAVPVKYILTNGYQLYHGHLVVDIEYDMVFGIDVPEEYIEF